MRGHFLYQVMVLELVLYHGEIEFSLYRQGLGNCQVDEKSHDDGRDPLVDDVVAKGYTEGKDNPDPSKYDDQGDDPSHHHPNKRPPLRSPKMMV